MPLLAVSATPDYRQRLFGLDEAHHPEVKKLAQWGEFIVRRIANNNREKGSWFVFCGGTGCGKTHVAKIIWRFARDYSVDMMLTHNIPHMMPLWLDWGSIADAKADDFEDILYDLNRAGLVAIDDLGAETDQFKSGINASRLRKVLNLCERKWLIVTTNLGKDECLAAYDGRATDRFRAARWVNMEAIPSYRSKLK